MNLRARVHDQAWLNELLDGADRWPRGAVTLEHVERIGIGYGLSGEIHRLHVQLVSGEPATLVAKFEDATRTRRAITAHQHVEDLMADAMPACYGWHLDGDEGVVLLSDVDPAIQGDELAPCSREGAVGLARTVARLHARTIGLEPATTPDVEAWHADPAKEPAWSTRVTRAAERYPELFDGRRERVEQLRGQVADAAAALVSGPVAWVHIDPHLDNVLRRPDGSTVLLDWSNARIGPPAVDVAVVLFSLSFADSAPMKPDEVIDVYAAELATLGLERGQRDLVAEARLAVVIHLQGIVGWAGEPSNEGFHDRKAQLRDGAIRRVFSAIDWLDGT